MKTIQLFLPCILLACTVACKKITIENIFSENQLINDDNLVSAKQIEEYLLSQTVTKGIANSYSLETYNDLDNNPLMYIVNFDSGGWQVLSADARTPAILAEGQSGSFSLDNDNVNFRFWLECMERDMHSVRNSKDENLKFSPFEISMNKAFWQNGQTRQPFPHEIEPEGFWCVSTQSETIIVDTCDHMVPKWDQASPYNIYCPMKTDGSSKNAPVGCVAVAGSQVLWYIQRINNAPFLVPSHCISVGDILSNSTYFYDYTTTVWNSMQNDYNVPPTDSVAVLLRYIGNRINMHYNNDYSWALPANLRTEVFNPFGIGCTHGQYNESIVQSSLESGMPVIVTATDLLIPIDFDIHCFVIDGYKKTRIKYTHHHYWQPNDPDILPNPDLYQDYYTYSYSNPEITAIKINWGWRSQWLQGTYNGVLYPLNDGWYTLTGDWVTSYSDGSSDSWNHNRQMIYGFNL